MVPAGNQQPALRNIGRRHPTDERHQWHAGRVMVPPQAQRVFLVTDEAAAWSGLERASAQCRVRCGKLAGAFF